MAQKILQCSRKDIPAAYIELLAFRLSKPKGLTEATRARRAGKQLNKLQRDNMIRFLYAQFRDLRPDGDFVEHPILGRLLIPLNISSRSERALWLVREVMDERLGYYPPSEATIRNIISRKIK
ncbi:hypothetical protein [Sphingopyxis sp. P8]|uniref:hypothetical protein n=1 Tax=Sphingopyxis sp. P8 TaxID=2763256 RepID=UPI001D09B013|nr:hypothetical protein [Sphingopyxis sp. P8]